MVLCWGRRPESIGVKFDESIPLEGRELLGVNHSHPFRPVFPIKYTHIGIRSLWFHRRSTGLRGAFGFAEFLVSAAGHDGGSCLP